MRGDARSEGENWKGKLEAWERRKKTASTKGAEAPFSAKRINLRRGEAKKVGRRGSTC